MADSNYNMIKPVENLQNVGSLTPVNQRKEKKQRRNPQEQNQEEGEQELNESVEKNAADQAPENGPNQHSIDYCA